MAKRKLANSDGIDHAVHPKRTRTDSRSKSGSPVASGSGQDREGTGAPLFPDEDDIENAEEMQTIEATQYQAPPDLHSAYLEESCRKQVEARRDAMDKAGSQVDDNDTVSLGAECGIIESVEMHHFMCHKRQQFELGPRLNFIIGQNGSGKSAVLTAITIALGGKAAFTGRGSGLKSLIREGQTHSEVSVVLRNEGPAAYLPALYGAKIRVTRSFNIRGSTAYKISNHKTNQVIATTRSELQAICDAMDIQIDNPITVLTQDAAKKFLQSTTPIQMYELFLRATLLDVLWAEYGVIGKNIDLISQLVEAKSSEIPEFKAEWVKARNVYAEAVESQSLRNRRPALTAELAWAYVDEKAQELEQKYQETALAERRVEKAQQKRAEIEARVTTTSEAVEKLEVDLTLSVAQVNVSRETRRKAQSDAESKRKELIEKNVEIKDINETVVHYNQEIAQLDVEIATESQKLQVDIQAERQALDARRDAINTVLITLEGQVRDASNNKDRLDTANKTAEAALQPARDAVATYIRSVADKTTVITSIGAGQRDPLHAFGQPETIRRIQQAIAGANWHGQKPIGPLGMFVTLKREATAMWGDLVRLHIGYAMSGYAITDSRDLMPMRSLLAKFKSTSANIYTNTTELFDYAAGEPPAEYITPLRLLEVSNELVKRVLVNNFHIEKLCLAATRPEAETMLRRLSRGGVAITKTGFQVTVYGGGGGQSIGMSELRENDFRQRLFQPTDRAEHLAQLRRELQNLQDQLGQSRAELVRLEKLHGDAGPPLRQAMTHKLDLDRQLRARQADLRQLEEESHLEVTSSVDDLEQSKQDKVEARRRLGEQFAAVEAGRIALQAELDDLTAKVGESRREENAAEVAQEKLRADTEAEVVQRTKDLDQKRYYAQKQQEALQALERLNDEVAELKQTYQEWSAKAEAQVGPKAVETTRPAAIIKDELDALMRQITVRDRRHIKSKAAATRDLAVARAALLRRHRDVLDMNRLCEALTNSLNDRYRRWYSWRAFCSMNCKLNFSYNLAKRGYWGKAEIEYEEKELKLTIKTDDLAGTHGHGKEPDVLSGGEKSFATLSLIMALWDTCGCPLRCLDEYDVFMDAVNRRISTRMMVATALASHGKQYILITPQDINAYVMPGPNVKLIRMLDPVRAGQARLPFA